MIKSKEYDRRSLFGQTEAELNEIYFRTQIIGRLDEGRVA